MNVFSSGIKCSHCGLINTPWRRYCKGCRQHLPSAEASRGVSTDETIKLYRSASQSALLYISSLYLGYETTGIHIQTAWGNIQSLVNGMIGPYLLLKKPALLHYDPGRYAHPHVEGRMIPLLPFSYPGNTELMADLKRYIPVIMKRNL